MSEIKKLILVRHAQSEMNKLGIHQGQLHDGELSPEGIEQAKSVADRLSSEGITAVYSSDMKRAMATAEIISQKFGLKVKSDSRLREFNMGDFDKTPEIRDSLFKEFYEQEILKGKTKYEIRPPNGENIWDFIDRTKSFLEEVKEIEGKVIVVAHGGTNEVLLNIIQGLDKYNFRRYHQDNTCVNEIIKEGCDWRIISINSTSHLKKLPKPEKYIYPDQEEIKIKILDKFAKIINGINIKGAYLFGSLADNKFGKYSEIYGRHKGSNVNILISMNKKDVPKEWKYVDSEGEVEIYESGKYKIGDIKHKIDFFVVSEENELREKENIMHSCSSIEKIK